MTTANYEGFAFKLSGLVTGSGSTIPSGISLQKVVLTTRDLLVAGEASSGGGLIAGEGANILINGTLLSGTAPTFRAVTLHTNLGDVGALVFSVGGDTYAVPLPGANFAATSLIAPSTVNTQAVSVFDPINYGLLPEDANTYTAQSFDTQFFGGPDAPSFSVGTATLYDTDLVRGNGEYTGPNYQETLTTLQFSDGSVLGAVQTLQSGGYSGFVTAFTYLFDKAALAASGHSLSDVRAVLSSTAFDHNLGWAAAGFTLQSGPIANGGGDNVPPPAPPPPAPLLINGTSRANTLVGTDARELLRGFDGNDTMTGGGGHDAFIFGTDSRSGVRSTDVIKDYQVGQDVIGLEGGASVRSIVDTGSAIVITLVGDNDRIVINGAVLNVADITILDNPVTFDFI